MKIWSTLRIWTGRICGLRRAIARELELIAAFAPLPNDLQHEIDLHAWPISRTTRALQREAADGCETAPQSHGV